MGYLRAQPAVDVERDLAGRGAGHGVLVPFRRQDSLATPAFVRGVQMLGLGRVFRV